MIDTSSEIIKFVEENDIGFIRLAFCDAFGNQKNISIMPGELPRALKRGISFDASAVGGFANVEQSDLFLVPDCSTVSVLPWRPASGRVMRMFCSVRTPDGSDCPEDGRAILRGAAERAAQMGYICKVGPECEFYLFRTDEDETPTLVPRCVFLKYTGQSYFLPHSFGEVLHPLFKIRFFQSHCPHQVIKFVFAGMFPIQM